MKKYAQIVNEETKLVAIGDGADSKFYKSIGMEEMEVEQAFNGAYYVNGYAPTQPLDELKQAKLVELKSMRDNLEVEAIEYNGNLFDYDEKARDRINAGIIALDLAGEGASLSWTTANNTEAVVTANDLRGVIANVAIRSNELHVKYRILKELVNNAQTKEEVDAITFDSDTSSITLEV